MLFAARLSHAAPEHLLLCVDALCYAALAVGVTCACASAHQAAVLYLAICIAANSPRHVAATRAACNQHATSEGQLQRLPAAVAAPRFRGARGALAAQCSRLRCLRCRRHAFPRLRRDLQRHGRAG